MDYKKIAIDNLCAYDSRSEYYNDLILLGETPEEIAEMKDNPCYCDNCFYGNDQLARIILELLEKGESEL